MNTIEQKFHDEIEVERLWVGCAQGRYVFLNMLPIIILMVIGLWDMVSHTYLLLWFLIVITNNLIRWVVLRFYHTHKESLKKMSGNLNF